MARRNIVPKSDCVLCQSLNLSTMLRIAFLRGYVCGAHVTAKGSNANERFCSEHSKDLDEAMATYVGNGFAGVGVGFPETNVMRLPTVEEPSNVIRLVSKKG